MPPRLRRTGVLFFFVAAMLCAGPQAFATQPGDLDGDGVVGTSDEILLATLWGGSEGGMNFDPTADLDGDGVIGLRDLALLSAAFGQQGEVDKTPPKLFITLNDIPDDMNDLLVVPPGGFQITIHFDSDGGAVVSPESLFMVSYLQLGEVPPLTNAAALFDVSPTRAVLEIHPDPSIAQTTHVLYATISNEGGRGTYAIFAFAVRDFVVGAPMEGVQTIFLDFDQDRSLGSEIDFIESLREFGLSSASAPQIEAQVRDMAVAEILDRTSKYFGVQANGDPGADPVNIEFTSQLPAVGHSRLCVGGESSAGPLFLGAAPLDIHNTAKTTDDCGQSTQFGVFPHAIDNLWQNSSEYQAAFGPVDPSLGGIPIGEDPVDAELFSGEFNLATATFAQTMRLWVVANALEAFSQTIASAIAHETGHMLGLTAPGATPAGLYGGTSGSKKDHNVTPAGATPSENYLMNAGATFSFGEISGRGGPLPKFRPLSWAYLHDRIALNSQVTAFHLAPQLDSVSPSPLSFDGGTQANFTLLGSGFTDAIAVKLFGGSPIPFQVSSTIVAPGGSEATSTINSLLVPPGTYDVQLTISDGQQTTLVGGLEVLP